PFALGGIRGGVFASKCVTKIPDSFPDGTAKTILLAEGGDPVPWMKPADLPYAPGKPLPKLGGQFSIEPTFWRSQRKTGINVLFADCSVRFLSKETDEDLLRKLITRQGGEEVDLNDLQP